MNSEKPLDSYTAEDVGTMSFADFLRFTVRALGEYEYLSVDTAQSRLVRMADEAKS